MLIMNSIFIIKRLSFGKEIWTGLVMNSDLIKKQIGLTCVDNVNMVLHSRQMVKW